MKKMMTMVAIVLFASIKLMAQDIKVEQTSQKKIQNIVWMKLDSMLIEQDSLLVGGWYSKQGNRFVELNTVPTDSLAGLLEWGLDYMKRKSKKSYIYLQSDKFFVTINKDSYQIAYVSPQQEWYVSKESDGELYIKCRKQSQGAWTMFSSDQHSTILFDAQLSTTKLFGYDGNVPNNRDFRQKGYILMPFGTALADFNNFLQDDFLQY